MIPQGTENKRFDTDFYVEGFATTFDKPYVMYEYGGIKYCEVIDRNALVGADLSDVIMQFDHSGMVFARNKMGKKQAAFPAFGTAGQRLIYCRKFEPYGRGEAPLCKHRRGAYLQNVVGVHRIGGRI